jgi:hypothetical protein
LQDIHSAVSLTQSAFFTARHAAYGEQP